MDWSTILASAGVSAVVGAVVSLVAVSSLTVRKARAEKRYAASEAVAEAIAPTLAEVVKYEAGLHRSLQRDPDKYVGQDLVVASAVLLPARSLGAVRLRLVRRRSVRLFGRFTVELAEASPVVNPDSLGALFAPLLAAQHGEGRIAASVDTMHDGLLHQALTEEKDSPKVKALKRELQLLARCR